MDHWTDDFEHSSVTDENRETFNAHMAKFPTQEDAVADGYGLAQMKGKPGKLPESLDSLPDDNARAEFTAGVHKLLGITHAKGVDDLADLDLKLGSTSDSMDDKLAADFKQFVVDNNKDISNEAAQLVIGFHNKAMDGAREAVAVATKAAEDKADTEFISAQRACNDALVAHPDFASQEELDKQTVLLHRALKDHAGIPLEEADGMAVLLKEGEGATNPVLRRLLLKAYAPLAAESSTEHGDGRPPAAPVKSEQDKQVAKDLGWDK